MKVKKIIEKVKKHLKEINLSFIDNTEDERWITPAPQSLLTLRNFFII